MTKKTFNACLSVIGSSSGRWVKENNISPNRYHDYMNGLRGSDPEMDLLVGSVAKQAKPALIKQLNRAIAKAHFETV